MSNCVTVQPVRGHLTPKNEYNLFYQKLDAKNFYIKQFFQKKQCFLRKLQKIILGAHLTIFQGKGASKVKN